MPSAVITVGLQEASYSVSEAEGVFSVCAVLSGQTERNVSVELSISQLPGTTAQGLVIIIFSITAGNNTMNAGVCIYYKLKLDTNSYECLHPLVHASLLLFSSFLQFK